MRSDNEVLPHHNIPKQSRRVKLLMTGAKIIWIGKLLPSDHETLLNRLKIPR